MVGWVSMETLAARMSASHDSTFCQNVSLYIAQCSLQEDLP